MTSNPVRFRHVTKRTTRKADGTITHKPTRLKYTVAYSFQKDASGKLDIAYGIAQCRNGANGDTFNRAEGRELAEARLSGALSGNDDGLRSGRLSVADGDGLNVGRYVAEQFEAKRKAALNK